MGRKLAARHIARQRHHAAVRARQKPSRGDERKGRSDDRGDFFEAHELLEPAWMGTDDLGERAFLQGLIKLAAAFVHATRGNPAGVAKNLAGALELLRTDGAAEAGAEVGIDIPSLRDLIAQRRTRPELVAIRIPYLAGPPR